jgi:hypothetical protein
VAILPFENAIATQKSIVTSIKQLRNHATNHLSIPDLRRIQQLSNSLGQTLNQANALDLSKIIPPAIESTSFFKAPTHTLLLNSSDQTLSLYHDPSFGKRFMNPPTTANSKASNSQQNLPPIMPPISALVDFIRGFYSMENQSL